MSPSKQLRFGLPILFVAMVLVSTALLVLSPPGASSPTDKSAVFAIPALPLDGLFDQTPGTRLLSPGEGPSQTLSYAFDPEQNTLFELAIEQRMTIKATGIDTAVLTKLSSNVEVLASREDRKQLFLSFEDFAIDVRADGEPVSIPALDTLLRGLKVQLDADAQRAFTRDSMSVAVNPQVHRMLSLLVDSLRQAHPSLPEEAVAVGAQWNQVSNWATPEDSSLELTLSRDYQLLTLSAELATIQGKLSIHDTKARVSASGTLEATLELDSRQLRESRMSFDFELLPPSEDDVHQRIELNFTLRRAN